MRYLITSIDGKVIASTLSEQDEKYFHGINCESLTSANGRFRLGKISNTLGSIWAISDDADFVKSSQKFKNTAKCILDSIKYINEIAAEQREINNRNTSRLIHNLTTLNAHNIQEIYSLIPQEEISGRVKDHISYVRAKISSDPTEASKVLLRIAKNNASMKTEFSVFKKLFVAQPDLRPSFHMMHKVLMNILYLFFPEFTDKEVEVVVERSEAVAYFDYESIHVALYHIIDNAAKYTRPDSKLYINITAGVPHATIVFRMMSTKILPHEREKIFDEGFSGSLPQLIGKSGSGIGMSLVKRILESNKGTVSHRSQPNSGEFLMGIEYQINEFILQLPSSKSGT